MHKKELQGCPMFKRLSYLLYMLIFVSLAMSAGAATNQNINVMTMNLYLGADLAPVFAATPETFLAAAEAALAQVAANNFPARAQALAAEIVAKNPQLVSLQEVYSFTINGNNDPPSLPSPFQDYLYDLLEALGQQGADYYVAAFVKDADIQVNLGGNLVGVTDRDVILARSGSDVEDVEPVDINCQGEKSKNGCIYSFVASAGGFVLKRGFVAVDATLNGTRVRFVDTHLELPYKELDPTNQLASFYQYAQAAELISSLTNTSIMPNPKGAKIIVAGDINSTPVDQILQVGDITIVPPYMQFAGAGYTDVWTLRPGNPPGFTCCQAENLLNVDSILSDRRDVTFSKEMPYGMVMVNLVGNEETDKTPTGLWPSDHAGVVTRMQFAPAP